MEGALEGDDAEALGMAGRRLVLAHDLDAALHRLGAGIAEKHGVGEGVGDQPLGQPVLPRDAEQVGGVPDLLRLLGQGLDQARVGVAQAGDRDAAGEVQITSARRS